MLIIIIIIIIIVRLFLTRHNTTKTLQGHTLTLTFLMRPLHTSTVGSECVVIVNAQNAGSGSLEIAVTCRGEEIPSNVNTGMHASDVEVTFVPKHIETHLANIYFNGHVVPGYHTVMQ